MLWYEFDEHIETTDDILNLQIYVQLDEGLDEHLDKIYDDIQMVEVDDDEGLTARVLEGVVAIDDADDFMDIADVELELM